MCCDKVRIFQICSFDKVISRHRSNLATTIDILFRFGMTLHGDNRIATHQSRITMCFQALTGTKHIAFDNRCACFFLETYRHRRIHLYTAYLTTTIDGTFYRTITDDDIRIAFRIIGIGFAFTIFSHHGFITEEVVSNTLAASEYITFNRHAFVS